MASKHKTHDNQASKLKAQTMRYKIGAAARLVGMPVTTLRVWEGRYQISSCGRAQSGHRLYSPEDVQRLSAIKQLTQSGHAISTLAHLKLHQLLKLQNAPEPSVHSAPAVSDLHVAVIGNMLALRLDNETFAARCARKVTTLTPFEDLEQLCLALNSKKIHVDVVVIHLPSLQPKWLESQRKSFKSIFALPVCVVYGFSSEVARRELSQIKVMSLAYAQCEYALCNWLRQIRTKHDVVSTPLAQVAGRRWSDEALANFRKLASSVDCECPKHVSELLVDLMSFETYSAQCESRSKADVELHRYLHLTASKARILFEEALERIAINEGLIGSL